MKQPIPYGRQSISDEDIHAVVRALRSDWLTTGPEVERFESNLAEVTGAPCVAVNSGTAALHAAYAAAGVREGAEIITSPLTFGATATAALHLGGVIRFADVTDDTLNLNPEAAAAEGSGRTRAIVGVDFAGHPADMDELRRVTDDLGAILIEDAAHSIGGSYRGRPVGSLGDLTTFSFHPVKTVTTAEGGAISTTVPQMLGAMRAFRNHGIVRDSGRLRQAREGGWHQEIQSLGLNLRMPDVLAALGSSQLGRLDQFVERRRYLVARYHQFLGGVDGLRLPAQRADVAPAWHFFPIRVLGGRRRKVFEQMRHAGIGVQVHYLPVYLHPLFVDMGYKQGLCPVAESAYDELLSLPLFPDMSESQQDRVVYELRRILGTD